MRPKLLLIMLPFLILGMPGHCLAAERSQGPSTPSLVSALRGIGSATLCGEPVPLGRRSVRERLEKELLLTLWHRPQAILWLKRAPRYLPHIRQRLRAQGLPLDLQYLAVAESGLRPLARSPRGAVGLWQFLKGTALRHGLRVDRYIDERRDPEASTLAALRMLRESYEALGSWALAMAAYNMGQDGLEAEILEQGTRDYYDLCLPSQTERYVLRILAAKLVHMNPDRFGLALSPQDLYPPIPSVSVRINLRKEVPVRLLAEAACCAFRSVKELNPKLRGYFIPPGSLTLRIPPQGAQGFEARFSRLVARFREGSHERLYVVQPGDTLSTIAARFSVPLSALLLWNDLDPQEPIHPGDRLIIPGRPLPSGHDPGPDSTGPSGRGR